MATEFEKCRSMSDAELVAYTRLHPMARLIPCVTILLERFDVEPEPPAEPTREKCKFCCGTGKSGIGKQHPCKNCNGTGLDLE